MITETMLTKLEADGWVVNIQQGPELLGLYDPNAKRSLGIYEIVLSGEKGIVHIEEHPDCSDMPNEELEVALDELWSFDPDAEGILIDDFLPLSPRILTLVQRINAIRMNQRIVKPFSARVWIEGTDEKDVEGTTLLELSQNIMKEIGEGVYLTVETSRNVNLDTLCNLLCDELISVSYEELTD